MQTFRASLLAAVVTLTHATGCSPASSGTPTSGASIDDGGAAAGEAGTAGTGTGGAASAPLSWSFDGTPTTFGNVSLNAPKGWTSKSSATQLTLTAPTAQGTCEIDVLAPLSATSGEAAQRAQLLAVVKAAFAGRTLTDPSANTTPTEGIFRGASPLGATIVGFDLLIDKGKLRTHAYLATFGSVAVPFATVWDPLHAGCFTRDANAQEAQLLHTLAVAGAPPTDPFPAAVNGDFSLISANVGEIYTFDPKGSFIFTVRTEFSGKVTTTQSDGTWGVSGNVMSFVPVPGGPSGDKAYSEYVRVYQSSNTSTAGGYDTFFCLLGKADPKTAVGEVCFKK